VGGISSIVKNGINGFLVEQGRPELIVEPVMKLLKNKELCRNMSQAARETVASKFSINGMVDRTEEVYKKVLAEP
jgi:glycosyltransferase involved in cell wall biosynthesis